VVVLALGERDAGKKIEVGAPGRAKDYSPSLSNVRKQKNLVDDVRAIQDLKKNKKKKKKTRKEKMEETPKKTCFHVARKSSPGGKHVEAGVRVSQERNI